MVAADAVKKGLEIAYSLAPELQQRKILGDTIRIRQVPACHTVWLLCRATIHSSVADRFAVLCSCPPPAPAGSSSLMVSSSGEEWHVYFEDADFLTGIPCCALEALAFNYCKWAQMAKRDMVEFIKHTLTTWDLEP